VYKPVASGGVWQSSRVVCGDVTRLHESIGLEGEPDDVCPQQFLAPLAPYLAAAKEGRMVDETLLIGGAARWRGRCDLLIVEGAGGILSPLTAAISNLDLASQFGYPVLVVARNQLGVINQTRLTLLALRSLAPSLPVLGVILNQVAAEADASCQSNSKELRAFLEVPVFDAAKIADVTRSVTATLS
jgi:dethiobiotin synthetase